MKRQPVRLERGLRKQNFAELYFRTVLTLVRILPENGRNAVPVVALCGCIA